MRKSAWYCRCSRSFASTSQGRTSSCLRHWVGNVFSSPFQWQLQTVYSNLGKKSEQKWDALSLSAVTKCRVSGCDPAWQFFSSLYSGGTVIRCVTCALLAGWTNIRKHPRSHSISISLLLGSSHYTNSFGENTIEFVFLNLLQFTFFFHFPSPQTCFFPQLNFRSISAPSSRFVDLQSHFESPVPPRLWKKNSASRTGGTSRRCWDFIFFPVGDVGQRGELPSLDDWRDASVSFCMLENDKTLSLVWMKGMEIWFGNFWLDEI